MRTESVRVFAEMTCFGISRGRVACKPAQAPVSTTTKADHPDGMELHVATR
jgi:hypothetical protein